MDNINERVTLGANYLQQPRWKRADGCIPVIETIRSGMTHLGKAVLNTRPLATLLTLLAAIR
jgi:hypothetical protein